MSRRANPRTRLSTRFLVAYAVAYLALIMLMGVIVNGAVRSALIDGVDEELVVAAHLAAGSVPEDTGLWGRWAQEVFDATGFRVTLIALDGQVVADSHSDPAGLEDHSQREEVVEAMSGVVGEAQRTSASTGFEQRYVALPPEDGLIVRTSVPTSVIEGDLGVVRRSIAITGGVLGVIGVAVVAYLARTMARPIVELTGQARAVAAGRRDVTPRRSPVEELDQLGVAIATIAADLGSRVEDAERATATLDVVLGAIPAGTVLFDADDRLVYSNRMSQLLLGTVPEHLSGLTPFPFQEAMIEARLSGEPVARDVEHGTPARHLHGVATPFAGDRRILLLVSDVTETQRTDSIRREFVANASHELKTPVSTITASAEALRISLDRGDGSAKGFAERIDSSARQLGRLVGDLLDLSRLEQGMPEKAEMRLDHVVAREVERASGSATAKGLLVEFRDQPVVVAASSRDIAIAVRNLLDNAIRHTAPGGSISVSVAREADQAVVTVTDNGEGIPSRDVERVFERFYRVDSARSRATGGTGLGLAIVKHVAEGHGGEVTLRSELGAGSSFSIRLPIGSEGESAASN